MTGKDEASALITLVTRPARHASVFLGRSMRLLGVEEAGTSCLGDIIEKE